MVTCTREPEIGAISGMYAVERPKRANRQHFMAVKKSRKCSDFLVYSYFTDSAFTAVLHKF